MNVYDAARMRLLGRLWPGGLSGRRRRRAFPLGGRLQLLDLDRPGVPGLRHRVDRDLTQVPVRHEGRQVRRVVPLVAVVLVDRAPQREEVLAERRLARPLRRVAQGRDRDGREDADDRHDDEELEEREARLAAPVPHHQSL